jgi:two-component system, cell cycle sensor histidine kinase and response regulator CckA
MHNKFNRRILVIDDNRAIHEDFRKILAVQADSSALQQMSADIFGEDAAPAPVVGFELDSAYQGQEGLEMMRKSIADDRPYAVAFVDVRMPPGWDGIETTVKLWEICPELQVVICTAFSDYDWEDIARSLGRTDRLLLLKKPFDPLEVLQMAETLTQKWTLARQANMRLADLDAAVNQRTHALRASNEKLAEEIARGSQTQILLSAFSTLGLLLGSTRTVREAGQIIVDTADRLLGYDACLLDLYSAESDILTRVLRVDMIDGHRKDCLGASVVGSPSPLARKTLQEGGQLVLKSDPSQMLPMSQPFGDTSRPSAAIMFVPIRNGKTVIGFLSIQSYTPNAYGQRSLETLQALADHCGGALDRIRTEEALSSAREQLRQSQKLEAIGQLAGGIAHDFNNLLTVIGGNVDLARMNTEGLPDAVTDCLDQISAAGTRAANLTRQLLAFSRKQMMQSQSVDLDGVIMNLSKMLKRLIGEDVELNCHYTPGLPRVQADVGMVEQVLVNLAVNARDAMPDGGQLVVSTEEVTFEATPVPSHPEARAGNFVCLTVKDTGTGIRPEVLPRIFDPFFTTKDVGKGTGLGLATVYGIVKQHQGWIEVSSQVGLGAAFKIHLPALQCVRPAQSERVTDDLQPPRGTETILLVEDEEYVRSVTRNILENSGYRVLEAGSGPEALRVWESAGPKIDLLLTDIVMPEGMNGRRLAEELRGRKTSLKVIFQSGYDGEVVSTSTDFLYRTSSCYLQKPTSSRELLRTVRNCLDGKVARRALVPVGT